MSNYRKPDFQFCRIESAALVSDLPRFAVIFKALSNPHRLSIFLKLADCTACEKSCPSEEQRTTCVGDLGKDLGIAASTVSHHIKELHHAGLMQMKRQGQSIACWVDPEALNRLVDFFSQLAPRVFSSS